MGSGRVLKLTVTIPNGATDSSAVESWNSYGNSAGILIQTPATLPETITIETSIDGINWGTYQEGAVDITLGADKSAPLDRLALAERFRFHSATPVGADRTFYLSFADLK